MKRKIAVSLVAAAAATALLGMSSPAYAAGPGGAEACPNGSVCLYYNSPQYGWGSFEHWTSGSYYLNGYLFSNWGNGSGYDQQVENQAASIVNNTGTTWNVCIDSGFVCTPYAPGYADSLGNMANIDYYLTDQL